MSARLAPRVDDPASRGFFELAAEGKLGVLTCTDCGARVHLPRPRCVGCGGNNLEWSAVAGRGRAKSWTVVEHQVHPLFPVPYTVVLIDVHGEQNVRMIGHLPGRVDVDETTEFVVEFEDLGPDREGNARVLPKWTIAKERVGDNRRI
ncbi:Zn-ribbon domain-containing OB-fold protein [Rhodococcus sp. ACPA1]|uniref:Zn-ribbon domain-containing OB-fold protein n=1 Tax=Rhodococcus sp. ACPA1 TaxID=2028572 RepID=UPI000BB13913|nr:zinc ribbon domain-containing protein [Rhodococcus sp. ACPA1]PBC47545.1 3-ketoacyl-CoA thiolase [Rhodococcus sp. ACPA1]